MHILLVVSWYKSPEHPLKGTFFEEQARALMAMGHQVGIFAPKIDLNFSSRFSKKIFNPQDFIDDGLPTMYVSVRSIVPRSRAVNYHYLQFRAVAKLKQYMQKYGRPDVIHAHCVFPAGLVATAIKEKFQIPFIVTEHFTGLIIQKIDRFPFNVTALRNVYQNSSKNIVVSNSFKADIVKRYRLKPKYFTVLPNMINPIFFEDFKQKYYSGGELVIFTNSFLTAKKNHLLLFSSFKIFLLSYPNAQLRVGGDGELAESLHQYVLNNGLSGNVCMLGELSRAQVKEELDKCHFFVSTSQYETFGVAIAEALACGRPVVVTNSGGPLDFVESSNGIIASTHEDTVFASAMIDLVKKYDSYNQVEIREACKRKFSVSAVMEQVADICHEVTNTAL